MIVPIGIIVAFVFGGHYEPDEIYNASPPLFLQGSTDWGEACIYVAVLAEYIIFGILAIIFLNLKLWESRPMGFYKDFKKSLWMLKYHIIAFIIGGTANIGSDTVITPNDFRNMFILMAILYFLTIIVIVTLNNLKTNKTIKIFTSTIFIILLLVVGSDGTTSKAGQSVSAGYDPKPIVRSYRHSIMLRWHEVCDKLFGNVTSHEAFYFLLLSKLLFGLVLIGISLYLINSFLQVINNKTRISKRRLWTAIIIIAFTVATVNISLKFSRFDRNRDIVMPVVKEVSAKLDDRIISLFKFEGSRAEKNINLIKGNYFDEVVIKEMDGILKTSYFADNLSIRILIPLQDDYFLFIWQNNLFRYADVRRLKNEHTEIIDLDAIEFMLKNKTDYVVAFMDRCKEDFCIGNLPKSICYGRVILDDLGQLTAILIVDKDR